MNAAAIVLQPASPLGRQPSQLQLGPDQASPLGMDRRQVTSSRFTLPHTSDSAFFQ